MYLVTEAEAKNREIVRVAMGKYEKMKVPELVYAAVKLGMERVIRGESQEDDVEATAIMGCLLKACVVEQIVGKIVIDDTSVNPVSFQERNDKLEVPNGKYALVSLERIEM